MSKIETLRSHYSNYRDYKEQLVRNARQNAVQLGDGFCNYLGLPYTYSVIRPNEETSEPYIKWFCIDDVGEMHECTHVDPALTILIDGSSYFGMGVTMDRDEQTFPKEVINLRVDVTPKSDVCTIMFAEMQSVDVPAKGGVIQDPGPAHELLFNMLVERFEQPDSFNKSGVGFHIAERG